MKKYMMIFASLLLVLGMAASALAFTTTGNNFTMNNGGGAITGGTNDVVVTWDGSVHSSLTGSSNMTITSNEPFQSWDWYATDVEVLGPGTYGIDPCAQGPASCVNLGIGTPAGTYKYWADIPAGKIGAHMLFAWGQTNPFPPTYCCKAACGIDLWNAWDTGKAYAGTLCAVGNALCGDYGQAAGVPQDASTTCYGAPTASVLDGVPNSQNKIWDFVSIDITGKLTDFAGTSTFVTYPLDGIPGLPFADGAFPAFNGNFNFMGNCNDNNACTTDSIDLTMSTGNICVHAPVSCPQGQVCNPVNGQCVTPGQCPTGSNGTPCNDGNACTTNDVCTNGTCAGTAKDCNDGNICTDDSCNPTTGACIHTNNTLPCNNGNPCTVADSCSGGVCVSGRPKGCSDGNVCTDDSCDQATGNCIHTNNTASCDDGNACTSGDVCSGGVCVVTAIPCCGADAGANIVDTTLNNFTMINGSNTITGGTNDVHFTWDGTLKTSVAVSGQVPNATISSSCPFFGVTWSAHDVALYGPADNGDGTYSAATYTVYTNCKSGSPGCGQGQPYTFTVHPGEIGAHMLFNWSVNRDIDLVNIWKRNAVFAPSSLCESMDNCDGSCGSNPSEKVWDWVSTDWDGDGITGAAFVDGPYVGFSGNFNVMGATPPPDGCMTGGYCKATVSDALKVLRIAAGIDTANSSQLYHGDVAPLVNGKPSPDGHINIGDAVVVLRKAVDLTCW